MPRRLPVYLLLDVSGSMTGEPIESVRNGLQMLVSASLGEPLALETAYLSVITFETMATRLLHTWTFPTPFLRKVSALSGRISTMMDGLNIIARAGKLLPAVRIFMTHAGNGTKPPHISI